MYVPIYLFSIHQRDDDAGGGGMHALCENCDVNKVIISVKGPRQLRKYLRMANVFNVPYFTRMCLCQFFCMRLLVIMMVQHCYYCAACRCQG